MHRWMSTASSGDLIKTQDIWAVAPLDLLKYLIAPQKSIRDLFAAEAVCDFRCYSGK